jgi:chemotaxis protein methyltransferase CheR
VDCIVALIYERSRIRLSREKEALIRARLGKRMRALGLATLPEYCDLLTSPGGVEEVQRAIDALTTNFTQFLREREHFEITVDEVLPRLLAGKQKQFGIWSAACATGEEPYTMAFHLEEHFPSAAGWDWRIRATDISTRALDKAARGIYPDERLADLPQGWVRKYFQRGMGSCAGHCRVKTHLQQRISFQQMNLLETAHADDGTFEVIFCRNVMIYFDRVTQQQVVTRLAKALRPGGYLFTGRSESLSGLAMPLKCLRPSIYQKPE